MNKEPFYFAYGFIASLLVCFTAFIISYVTCEWYCNEMLDRTVKNTSEHAEHTVNGKDTE